MKNPRRNFPRAFFIGITITGIVYMLVAFVTTALVPIETLRDTNQDLLEVVRIGAAWFPLTVFSFIAMCAVTNTSLINLMMASRLIYGMAREQVVPPVFAAVHSGRRTPWAGIVFTTVLALALASWGGVRALGGTTALLLLVRVHDRERRGARCCAAGRLLTTTIAHRRSARFSAASRARISRRRGPGRDVQQYKIAGVLLAIGAVLFVVNWLLHGRKPVTLHAENLGKS